MERFVRKMEVCMRKIISILLVTLVMGVGTGLAYPMNSLAASPQIDFTPTVKGDFKVQVDVETNLPNGSTLAAKILKHGLRGSDLFVGTDFIKFVVNNGVASALIDAERKAQPSINHITKGKYNVEATFYPLWRENREIANRLGIRTEIEAIKVVELNGNGK
jgi:hypothetical protein